MNDKGFEKLIKTIDIEIIPPKGIKEKMLGQILTQENNENDLAISGIESLIFEKTLRFACALAFAISGTLWAVMGNGYTVILSNIVGIR